MDNCPTCGIVFTPDINIGCHVRWCKYRKENSLKDALRFTCELCGKKHTTRRRKFCSESCRKEWVKQRSNDPLIKEEQSRRRKEFLKDNPDKHPWKNNSKFKSKPCEVLKEKLVGAGINYVEEYNPLVDRQFAIDIAFPDVKVGIEVNGNQHYNKDGTLRDYYQNRHDLITESGWLLIEIPYKRVFNIDLSELLGSILTRNQPDYSCYVVIKEDNRIHGTTADYVKFLQEKSYLNNKPKIDLVLNSDIDFTKFGWSSKLAKLIGIKPQKSKKWLMKWIPELYYICYKKQSRASL